jgi:hypothetical protein
MVVKGNTDIQKYPCVQSGDQVTETFYIIVKEELAVS